MNPLWRMIGRGAAFRVGRRVLVAGRTGVEEAWLYRLGARVSGLGLPAAPGGAFEAMRHWQCVLDVMVRYRLFVGRPLLDAWMPA